MEKMNQVEFTNHIDNVISKTAKELADSPKSRAFQGFNHVGFYQGFCYAKGWDQNYDKIREWNSMITD